MSSPAIFIGLVSHQMTKFTQSQGVDGLVTRLAAELQGSGQSCVVQINIENLWDEGIHSGALGQQWQVDLDRSSVQRSLTAQLDLESRWSGFLGRTSTRDRVNRSLVLQLGRLRRRLQSPDPLALRRLLNIELSHLALFRAGLASGAPWILIVEDDAKADDVADLAAGLQGLFQTNADFVNLSLSFDTKTLRIDHLLRPAPVSWSGTEKRLILQADRPVTNTVCAILYSAAFLAKLEVHLNQLPMTPVLPIDWKLNAALMQMFDNGSTKSGACWLIEPAPIIQMSMHEGATP